MTAVEKLSLRISSQGATRANDWRWNIAAGFPRSRWFFLDAAQGRGQINMGAPPSRLQTTQFCGTAVFRSSPRDDPHECGWCGDELERGRWTP